MPKEARGRIRFTSAPQGQAPQWVREAWIGVTVPCFPFTGTPPEGSLCGVENGKVAKSYECALVPEFEAIEALEKHNSEAARWWRGKGFGSRSDSLFAFNVDSFEIIE